MRAETHGTARAIIHQKNLKVVCIEHTKGGVRYQCRTRAKKRHRKCITIVVPPNAPQVDHPNHRIIKESTS